MTNPRNLDARYGRVRRSRASRRMRILVASLIAAALVLAWFIWANPVHFGQSVEGAALSHRIVDDTHTSVTFEVTAEAGRRVACAISAKNLSFEIVGWKVFVYPASTQVKRTFTETILTTRRPVTGLVEDCWLT